MASISQLDNMEEEEDTGVISNDEISSEDDSSQGPTHYDVAAQAPTKWSEVATMPIDDDSGIILEMAEMGRVDTSDVETNLQTSTDVEMNPQAEPDVEKNPLTQPDLKKNAPPRGLDVEMNPETDPQAEPISNACGAMLWKYRGQLCEVLVLTPVFLIIIGLFLVPTVFYALPIKQVEVADKVETDCREVTPYSGEVCNGVLTSLQMCFSGETTPPAALNIPGSLIDQQRGERDAMTLVNGLCILDPSPQCREAIMPFLCLFFFSLCDSSNHLHTILREDCLELRDDICAEEWSLAVGFLGAGVLPVCEELSDDADECIGNSSLPTPDCDTIFNLDNDATTNLQCSDGFYFDENDTNLCRPTCGEFNPTPLSLVIIRRGAISFCFVTSIIMLLLLLTKQRKTLLVFPTVTFVYLCITTFIASLIVIIGYIDNKRLFCGSKDLINATMKGKETPFCTLSGFVFIYLLGQTSMWGLIHGIFLLWAVRDPFGFRRLKKTGRIRYAHIICVAMAVVLPLVAPCALLRDGYINTATPSQVCVGRSFSVTYYALILPVSFIVGLTSCLLSLFFWTLFKELILKKLLAGKKVPLKVVWKAQFKIACITLYYVLLGVVGLAVFTFTEASSTYQKGITSYILCESSGQPSDCSLDLGIDVNVNHTLTTITFLLLSFLPVLAILFGCDPQAHKNSRRRRSTFSTSMTSMKRSIKLN